MATLRLPALETFSGKQEEYESFSRRLKAYFISQNETYKKLFKHAEKTDEPITDELLNEHQEELKMSRDLHYYARAALPRHFRDGPASK